MLETKSRNACEYYEMTEVELTIQLDLAMNVTFSEYYVIRSCIIILATT